MLNANVCNVRLVGRHDNLFDHADGRQLPVSGGAENSTGANAASNTQHNGKPIAVAEVRIRSGAGLAFYT